MKKFYLCFTIILCFCCCVTLVQAQCPPGTTPVGNNLVVNGDFSGGNSGFSSGYIPGTGGAYGLVSNAGQYAIVTSPAQAHNNFGNFGDHTSGTGNMLVVNGSGAANTSVWCQTITVQPNTVYTFSTWIASADGMSPAILQFSINGNNLGLPFYATPTVGDWQQFFITWYSGINTNATICIVNQNTSTIGNDFAIDDIYFLECECTLPVSITPDTTVCEGSIVQLNATGGDSYFWYPSTGLNNATIADPLATVNSNITYYAIISSSLGCIDTASVTINIVPQQQISAGLDVEICPGDSVQLNASGSGIISWSPSIGLNNSNILNPKASPAQTTDYILTITDGPCVFYDTVRVFVKPLPQVDAGVNDSICYGSSLALNGSGIGNISWTPNSNLSNPNVLNPVTNPLQTTTYFLSIEYDGCVNMDSVTIFVKQLPVVNAGADKTICYQESVQLNGTGNGTVTWTPTTGLNNPNIINPVANPLQTTNYILNILKNGCENSDTVTVTVKPLPMVNAGVNDSVCFGENIQLGGNGSGIISWTPAASLSNATILNPVASPLQTTNYILQIDSGGCKNTDTVTVFVKSLPIVHAGINDTVCAGDTIQLDGSGTGNVIWSPANLLSDNTILNPVAILQQTTEFVLTIEENNCINKDTVLIVVKQLPFVDAGQDQNICIGSSVQLNGTGSGLLSWSPDSGMYNSNTAYPVVSPVQNTYYIFTVLSDGCYNSDTVTVTVIPLPDIDAGKDLKMCEGGLVQLSAQGAATYLWSPMELLNNAFISNPLAAMTQNTEFIVTGTLNGCSNTDTVLVVVVPLPDVDAGNDTIVSKYSNFKLSGFPGNGSWANDNGILCTSCTEYEIFMETDQVFYYSYRDSNGCENSDTIIVVINRQCKDPFFPTAFTPNDDLLNDYFHPVFEDIYTVIDSEFIIYNKWGEQVFYTNNINEAWDGKSKGLPQSMGVYAFVYRFNCETDTRVIKGTFTLVR